MAETTSPKKAKLSSKQRRKLHMQGLSREERGYLRRRAAAEKVWPIFRFVILFGLSFIILYPLIYMVSCAFRERNDMSDPTVMWIPRHYTIDVIKETMRAMNFWETMKTTLLLNIGCALVQVVSCSVTGYGFARFDFKGKKLLFGIVIMMILVPMQVIALPLYTQFRFFLGSEKINLIDTMWVMYLPALTGNGIRSGLMILIFRQFFRGLPKEIEDAAYQKVPSIIFIDEIDSILSKRSESENEATKRLKTEFLIQFDGLGSNTSARLLVIAATNRPMDLDEALLRRLPKRVYCGPLDEDGRFEFIKKVINRVETDLSDEDIREIAKMTNDYSNSDLMELCREAAYKPVRELTNEEIMKLDKFRPINKKDLVDAAHKIRGTLSKKVKDELRRWNEQFGGV